VLLGIDLDSADKVQIAKGKFIVLAGGKEYSCRVRELGNDVRAGCGFCDDLTGRLADISIGSIGSPDGYSTVIVRSDRGKRLLDEVLFCQREINKDEIVKLSGLKERNAKKNFSIILKCPSSLLSSSNSGSRHQAINNGGKDYIVFHA
jgi:coenzyme F420 hydrogenase subunit beta